LSPNYCPSFLEALVFTSSSEINRKLVRTNSLIVLISFLLISELEVKTIVTK
jgi:hypothetical protein